MKTEMDQIKEIGKEIMVLMHTMYLLSWDQETYMPPKAVEGRAEQLSLLEGLLHEKVTSEKLGVLFDTIGASEENPRGSRNLAPKDGAFIRKFFREYMKEKKLPKRLVVDLAKEASIAHSRWVEAREKDDFAIFEPHLKRLLELTAEKIEKLGYS